VDEFLVFNSLDAEAIRAIVAIQARKLSRRLHEQGMEISLGKAVIDTLAETGYAPELGARPLRSAMRRLIEQPLSRAIIEGRFKAGDHIQADLDAEGRTAFTLSA
jgi:ATP-dependent Clp protease ATP-binding subunit ClpA